MDECVICYEPLNQKYNSLRNNRWKIHRNIKKKNLNYYLFS